ncbi:MAG: cadherin-like beta sandwich domain-containing protein [Lachnospiraceae bacterium]|jgi:hypothetical protein|nr:cadherin-like beta sandwich domain-containing protein [Lachnospiraceae bacterium]
MKKIILIAILIILIISSIIIPTIYAGTVNNVMSIPEKQIKIGENLKVYINVENITEYKVSKIVLGTDIYLEPVLDTLDTGMTVDDTEFKNKTKEFTIINIPEGVKTICVLYTIPNYIANNTKVKITATVFDDKEEEKTKQDIEITIVNDKTSDNNTINNDKQNENTMNENTVKEEQQTSGADKSKTENTVKELAAQTTNSNGQTSNTNKTQISNIGNSMQTVTYKGNRNNYLSNITVDGYELTPIFNKTNNTYFMTVKNDVTSVGVKVEKEDNSAVVVISGNKNLIEGQNKILISVTADNGNVRYYRLYVSREGVN